MRILLTWKYCEIDRYEIYRYWSTVLIVKSPRRAQYFYTTIKSTNPSKKYSLLLTSIMESIDELFILRSCVIIYHHLHFFRCDFFITKKKDFFFSEEKSTLNVLCGLYSGRLKTNFYLFFKIWTGMGYFLFYFIISISLW